MNGIELGPAQRRHRDRRRGLLLAVAFSLACWGLIALAAFAIWRQL